MRFFQNQNASIAAVFALTSIPALAMVGAAMDYSNSGRVQTGLRDTLDAAAIAGALANAKPTREDETRTFVRANAASRLKGVTLGLVQVAFNDSASTVTVTGEANVKTTFSQLFGVTSVNIKQSSTAAWSGGSNRISFVIDATGSLRRAGVDAELRTAAKNFVDQLSGGNANPSGLYISVVPFASMVNVGPDKTNWLSAKYNSADYMPGSWSGCVIERQIPGDISISTPYKGEFDPHIWPKTYTAAFNFNDWTTRSVSEFRNGVDGKFPDQGGPEILGPNVGCMSPIMPLTSDMTAVKTRIDELVMLSATGGTTLAPGMAWGWRMLSPDWAPFWRNGGTIQPQDKLTGGTIVLISDGENTWYYDDQNNNYGLGITGYGRPEERRNGYGPSRSGTETAAAALGTTASDPNLKTKVAADMALPEASQKITPALRAEQTPSIDEAKIAWDNRLGSLCKDIKSTGIEIYTILFAANVSNEKIMRDCASSKANYFHTLSSKGLEKAFKKIANTADTKTVVRIVK